MSDHHQPLTTKQAVRTRIAPSPTGFPHVGSAYQSLFDYVWAKKHQGQFVLRLEDTDRARLVDGADQQIFDMIRWVGVPYDEGPDIGGPYGPYIQSERLSTYQQYADQLLVQGQAYYCFCTPERLTQMRAEQEKNHQPPKYDRHCLSLSKDEVESNLAAGMPRVIRLNVPDGQTSFTDRLLGEISIQNNEIDDQVLMKSDGFPTYHLAVVVDDHLMEITDVIRGPEWIPSTPKHVLLYQFFGWDMPSFTHIPLLLNADKSKLSKRKNDVSLISYRQQGYLPEALLNYLSQLGWSHPDGKEIYTLDEMIELFSWDRVPKTGSVFSFDKLRWYNGHYIRALSDEELALRLREYSGHSYEQILAVLPLVKDRLVILSEFDSLVEFIYNELAIETELLVPKNQTAESTKLALIQVIEALSKLDQPWQQEPWEQAIRQVATDLGWKAGELFMSLRVAVTYSTASPPLRESMLAIGEISSLERIDKAIKRL